MSLLQDKLMVHAFQKSTLELFLSYITKNMHYEPTILWLSLGTLANLMSFVSPLIVVSSAQFELASFM
jgi:hypothetical protein